MENSFYYKSWFREPIEGSIEYHNLYTYKNKIYFFCLLTDPLPPYTFKFGNFYPWRPEIKQFSTCQELSEFIKTLGKPIEIPLSAMSDNPWYGNIGHALFDGFYGAYLALVKFGHIDNDFVYFTSEWNNRLTLSTSVIETFSGKKIREYTNLNHEFIHFDKFISGVQGTGNVIMNKDYTLIGENYNGLKYFKNRMLSRFEIHSNRSINKKLKIGIINNKRYLDNEKLVLNELVEVLNEKYDISFVDWYHDFNGSFKKQLEFLSDLDIQITGPGTGMMYTPFMKRYSVNINLGCIEHTQTNGSRPNIKIENTTKTDFIFPAYMEQSVCAATYWVNTLYYPREEYNEIQFSPLLNLINQADELIKHRHLTGNNHNLDARVFIEYCKRAKNAQKVCDHLTNIAFFVELFVQEHPHAIAPDFVEIELLRQIKTEFNFNRKYEIIL